MAKTTPLVTLLTDFGHSDPYVAAMKGVILSVCPRAQVVDLSHDVPAHDVLAGGFVLAEAAPYFPLETVHVVVVDPGVGTDRKILAARIGGQVCLFPDNGVITFLAGRLPLEQLVTVTNTQYVGAPGTVSRTFHGRDIFAPVAGRIANGLGLGELGPQASSYQLLDLPAPGAGERRIRGQVIYVDRFGNAVSNIPRAMVVETFGDLAIPQVWAKDACVGGLKGAYGFVAEGELLSLFNSMNLVEIAANQAPAAERLGLTFGSPVHLLPPETRPGQ